VNHAAAADLATRIAMWSGPRTVSTALMRAWENRPDTGTPVTGGTQIGRGGYRGSLGQSPLIFPSWSSRTESAMLMRSGSWVATRAVTPSDCTTVRIRRMICFAVSESS